MAGVSKYDMTLEIFTEEWLVLQEEVEFPLLYYGYEEIAKLFGISIGSAKYFLRKLGITKRKEYDEMFSKYPLDSYSVQYLAKKINKEPKTIREIAETVGMPYVTVRKYMKWAYERGLATVVETKKERGAISEKWLLTFVPEVIEIKEDNLAIKIKLKIKMRREFCEQICPLRDNCPNFERIKKGEEVVPYREVEIERRKFIGDENKLCKPIALK